MSNDVGIVDQMEGLEGSRQSLEENDYKTKKNQFIKADMKLKPTLVFGHIFDSFS